MRLARAPKVAARCHAFRNLNVRQLVGRDSVEVREDVALETAIPNGSTESRPTEIESRAALAPLLPFFFCEAVRILRPRP